MSRDEIVRSEMDKQSVRHALRFIEAEPTPDAVQGFLEVAMWPSMNRPAWSREYVVALLLAVTLEDRLNADVVSCPRRG